MKFSTCLTLLLLMSLITAGVVARDYIRAEAEVEMNREVTKRQEMIINCKLQLIVNEMNSPTEAERPSAWRS